MMQSSYIAPTLLSSVAILGGCQISIVDKYDVAGQERSVVAANCSSECWQVNLADCTRVERPAWHKMTHVETGSGMGLRQFRNSRFYDCPASGEDIQ